MTRFPTFAQMLQEYLGRQDRSARWLADRLGVAPSTVTRWCNGETRPRDPETVRRIADVLGIFDGEERARLLKAAGYAVAPEEASSAGTATRVAGAEMVPGSASQDESVEVIGARPAHVGARKRSRLFWAAFGILLLVFLGMVWMWRGLPAREQGTPTPIRPTAFIPAFVPTAQPTSLDEENDAAVGFTPVCGESRRLPTPEWNRFLRTQGVSLFTPEDTQGGVWNAYPRVLALDDRGLWIGYFGDPAVVGHYDGRTWAHCTEDVDFPVANINALVIDGRGWVWAGMEKLGVMVYDGETWRRYTSANGLPSDEIFGMTVGPGGQVWAMTWEGVARFDGDRWSTPYSVYNETLVNNHTGALAFDGQGNIWVGYLGRGLSRFNGRRGIWEHYRAGEGTLGGDKVRDILVRPAQADEAESVWIATMDGGITRYMDGVWTVFGVDQGLPDNRVAKLALDRYARVWAATQGGVAYYDGQAWQIYTTLDTRSLAIGPACTACPFDQEDVWTGVWGQGVAHSGLPFADPAVRVLEVKAPAVVAPGESFRPEVTVMPLWPHRLEPGDFLAHIDAEDRLRFGAWPHMAVTRVVAPGEPYTFTDYDNPFVAPTLEPGEETRVFTSTWRVWMDNRYVGPSIPITFTVQRADRLP